MLSRLLLLLSLVVSTACATVPGQNAPLPQPPGADAPEGERWSYYQAHGADGLVDRRWPEREGRNLRLRSGAEVRHVENLAPVLEGSELAAEAQERYERAKIQAERTHLAYMLVSASVMLPMTLLLFPANVALFVDLVGGFSSMGHTLPGDIASAAMGVWTVTGLPWLLLNLPVIFLLGAHAIDAQLKQDKAQEQLLTLYDEALRERLGLPSSSSLDGAE